MRSDSSFSSAVLRQALDAAPDGIAVIDSSGTILAVNRMFEQLFEYSHDELVGMSVDQLLPDTVRGSHAQHRAEYTAHPRTRAMGSGLDLLARRGSGTDFPVEISLSPLQTDDGMMVVAIVRDVTERRAVEAELRRAHEELTVVDDRERIARDLHDTVIQRLFAVGLSLQGAITRAVTDPAVERIHLAIDEIDLTIRDIRSSIFALHTRRDTGESTRDEVAVIVREAARVLGFEPVLRVDGPIDTVVSTEIRAHLLATLREALSNVTKHAHASSVMVDIFVDGSEVCLRVRDNGVGTENRGSGSGLDNIRERALANGGSCTVTSPETGGTQVEWRVRVGPD
jgi:two-component system, NarL family, sensor histidine kinase DevS